MSAKTRKVRNKKEEKEAKNYTQELGELIIKVFLYQEKKT